MFPNEKMLVFPRCLQLMGLSTFPQHGTQGNTVEGLEYFHEEFCIHPAGKREFMKSFKQGGVIFIFASWAIALEGVRKMRACGQGSENESHWNILARDDESLDLDHGNGDKDANFFLEIKEEKTTWTWLNMVIREGEESGKILGFLASATGSLVVSSPELRSMKIESSLRCIQFKLWTFLRSKGRNYLCTHSFRHTSYIIGAQNAS